MVPLQEKYGAQIRLHLAHVTCLAPMTVIMAVLLSCQSVQLALIMLSPKML